MIKKNQQPFLTFKNERTVTEYTCTLLLALFTFVHVPTLWQNLALKWDTACYFFSTHKNRKPTTHRPYTPTECIDIPWPATVLCTTYCSQHISTAEINTFRHLLIVSIFLSWVFRPHWPFSTSVKVSQDALKTGISLSSPLGIQEYDYNTAISWFINITLRHDGKHYEK